MKRIAAFLPLLLSGCWYLKQGAGQLDLLWNSRPLEEVVADPLLPADHRRKLELIREVKAFGIREMGLSPSGSYERYYDTGGKPVTWLVTACAKDRFEPYTWWFPIVGTVPYKGHFAREDAEAEAQGLEAQGLDVYVSPAAAYSTLGWFNDPVLSTMLAYDDEQLVNLILHELTHGTLYLPGGTEFNEGLASFVGGQGALEFFRKRDGLDSTSYARAVWAMAREERRDARAIELFQALDALYRSKRPREGLLREREEVAFQLRIRWREADGRPRKEVSPPSREVNNAAILMQRRYGRYDQFRKVFEEAGGSWTGFFERMATSGVRTDPTPSPSAGSAPSPP